MFVEFKKIEFNNYKTIKNSSLSLSDRGVILIQGVNNDKGGSNGAGKSTIANGLLWCLYDRTLVGKETDKEIIPKFIKKKVFTETGGCWVTVYLKRDDIAYRIIRYRKSLEYKNTVRIAKWTGDSVLGKFQEISKCTDKETNVLIEEIVGADFHSFVHSNIFSFNNIDPFLSLSDKDKKELVLPKYFIDMFKSAYKKCGEEIKKVDVGLDECSNDILSETIAISEKKLTLKGVEDDITAHNEILKATEVKLHTEKCKRDEIKTALQTYREGVTGCNDIIKKFEEEAESCKVTLQEWTVAEECLNSLCTETATIERDINAKKLEMEEYKREDKSTLTNKIATISDTIRQTTDSYNDVVTQIKDANECLTKETKTKDHAFDIGVKLQDKLLQLILKKQRVDDAITSKQGEEARLISQKEDVSTKYYSEECKSCPHNKMSELTNRINNDLVIIKEELVKYTNESVASQDEINECNVDIKETGQCEDICKKTVDKITRQEIGPLESKAYAFSEKLHNLKNTLTEFKLKVDNAEAILVNISSIESALREMDKTLGNNQLEAKNLAETCPSQNIKYFSELRNEIKNKILSEDQKKRNRLDVVNEKRVELGSVESTIKGLEEALAPNTQLEQRKESLENQIRNSITCKEDTLAVQTTLNNKLELLKFWKNGFSPAGIEGFMMDSLVNAMNSLIQKYLGYLSSNTMSLTLIPDSTLKSGATRNKISEKVENDSGGNTYRTNSEGEKRIMDIAVLFSLKYIYEQITGTRYNVLFLDEAFDTLDAATCSLVINLINTLDEITSIFVVSHIESISLEFDSFIKMIKTKGISEIVNENNQ